MKMNELKEMMEYDPKTSAKELAAEFSIMIGTNS